MSDTTQQQPVTPPQTEASLGEARVMALVCYALFLATLINGVTGIIGVVLAYIKRADARGTIWESHFTNLIHVFWSGVLLFTLFIAVLIFGAFGLFHAVQTNGFPGVVFLAPVLWLCFVAYIVWYLYRTLKGLVRAVDNQPYS